MFIIYKILWPICGTVSVGFIWYDYQTDVKLFTNPRKTFMTHSRT